MEDQEYSSLPTSELVKRAETFISRDDQLKGFPKELGFEILKRVNEANAAVDGFTPYMIAIACSRILASTVRGLSEGEVADWTDEWCRGFCPAWNAWTST